MKRLTLAFGLLVAATGWLCGQENPQEINADLPPVAEPGFKYVQKTEYKEIEFRYCKMVPDKRTRWVYSTKPDSYCVPPCPFHGHHHQSGCEQCEACQACKGPFCRPQLMKKQIEWECGQKCVIETVKQKMPYLVWSKVRITDESKKGSSAETLPSPRELTDEQTPKAKSDEAPKKK